mmetsp:Transcript_23491/g.58803  ORF Transcript_23491/g.58803 Transcript_23491/m.58803 type:complete len:1527 (-) Transcript_23491:30-4610(-)|eukprot:CAMPEP_0174245966 /NCGR_PEP_ID=MMETSP0417-20130205/41555_1 /TAXON_ID=242541 /ORGANISM="Mayorella sp, Strain BSH-02190019" /LENGTH=1526 /DNA_ID=CAMNT_0015325801 /DNA_START=315 /DNA_END=4895 /DNA_ORIENTATION=+
MADRRARKEQDKLKSKLAKFHDKNASVKSRFRSLMAYLDKASSEDLQKFFNDHFYVIYGVFLDQFSAYESACKRNKHDQSTVMSLLQVLHNVLKYLQEYVRKGWQIRSIANVLEKALYIENKQAVRKFAFELLLAFLEQVYSREEAQLDLLGASIDLTPLTVDYRDKVILPVQALQAPDRTSILVPSGTSVPTVEDTVQLFEIMLHHISDNPAHFDFWFRSLKEYYLNVFYPQVANGDQKVGFRPYAPALIQEVFIPHLDRWMRNPDLSKVLWGDADNRALLLEIYCQSCHLEVQFDKTIKKSIILFRMVFVESPPQEITDSVTEYRQLFLQKLPTIFSAKTPLDSVSTHVSLCLEVLQVFKYMFAEAYETLSPDTQEVLLYTLLNTSTELLAPSSPNQILSEALAAVCIDTILFIWIRTKSEKPDHWQALQDGMAGLFHSMEIIETLKVKVVQLTLVICNKIYPIKWKEKKQKKTGGLQQTAKAQRTLGSPDSVPAPKLPAPDPAITMMQWNVDEILYVWNNMLSIFSKVNQIKDPKIHKVAINVLTEIIDIVSDAEVAVPFVETLEENRPKPLYLVNVFGPWLFEACNLPDTYVEGKAEAYRALCRMFCRHHQRPLPLDLLGRFYAALHSGITTPSQGSAVQYAILESANNIFNLSLSGASVLIPYFLDGIRRVLSLGKAPLQVQRKAVLILGSLLCYSNHYRGLDIPVRLDSKLATELTKQKQMKYDAITPELVSILLLTMRRDGLHPELQQRCLWLSCVMIFEELANKPDAETVCELIKTQIKFCTSSNTAVARAALDALSSLTTMSAELLQVNEALPALIVESLCTNIIRELTERRKAGSGSSGPGSASFNEQTVAEHFHCLCAMLMTFSAAALQKPSTLTHVFQAVELGVLGQRLGAGEAPASARSENPTKVAKTKRKSFRPSSATEKQSSQPDVLLRVDQMFDLLTKKPAHESEAVQAAAEVLLHSISHFMSQVPGKEGIQLLHSDITEEDDVPDDERLAPLHFLVNSTTILSLVEVSRPGSGERVSRVILRNLTGLYSWENRLVFDPQGHPDPLPFNFEPAVEPGVDASDAIVPAPPAVVDADDAEPVLPTLEAAVAGRLGKQAGENVDQLGALLTYLSLAWKDCLPESGRSLNQPAAPLEEFAEGVKQTRDALTRQATEDSNVIAERTRERPDSEFWMFRPPGSPTPQSHYHLCRQWLSHLGLLDQERHASVVLLDSKKAARSIATLDRTHGRETAKVGVIYVAKGQDDQMDILGNDSHCRRGLYAEFLRGLGWPIDLLTHPGYVGGLDNSERLTCGETAPYFAAAGFELVFHESAGIPTDLVNDAQLIATKRHVGNDSVHIVYSEHVRDYDCQTIVSEFNDAHIVVYPLESGLFRVQISRKNDVELFGPVMHGMALSKKLLAPLARLTAFIANKYVRLNMQGYQHPFLKRREVIQQMGHRFALSQFYEEFLPQIIQPPAYQPQESSGSRVTPSSPKGSAITTSPRDDISSSGAASTTSSSFSTTTSPVSASSSSSL